MTQRRASLPILNQQLTELATEHNCPSSHDIADLHSRSLSFQKVSQQNGTKTPKAKYRVPRKSNRVVYVQNVRGVAFDSFPECFRFLTQALAWHV